MAYKMVFTTRITDKCVVDCFPVSWVLTLCTKQAVAYINLCLAYPNEILPHVHHSCWPTQNLLGPLTGLPIWKFLEPYSSRTTC